MATLVLPAEDLPGGRIAPVCIKTGRQTADTVTVDGVSAPRWVGGLVLFGIPALLVAG